MTTTHIKSPYSAENVAKHFIYLASQSLVGDKGEREGITNLKLQKILYFAQAYFLSKLSRPLFNENIEAWEYGPVVPTVYRKYSKHGSETILSEKDEDTISDEDKVNLKRIWELFGGYSARRLVDIAHAHSPWKDAYASHNKVISHKSISEYYTPILNK